jgi:hypothetical protein
MLKVGQFRYQIPSFEQYRESRDEDALREYNRRKQREYRAKDKENSEVVKKELAPQPAKKLKPGSNIPPTPEEVSTYCMQRGNIVNADKFYNFYDSKGWRVGKNPMKNWQAACRSWEQTEKEKQSEGKPKGKLARAAEAINKSRQARLSDTPARKTLPDN